MPVTMFMRVNISKGGYEMKEKKRRIGEGDLEKDESNNENNSQKDKGTGSSC